MSGNRQMEMHYVHTGCPYTITDSFTNFFDGFTHVPINYSQSQPIMHDQDNFYWSTNAHPYKFDYSGNGITYYVPYGVNDHLPQMDFPRRAWGYPSITDVEEPPAIDVLSEGDANTEVHATPEECSPNYAGPGSSVSEVLWQDSVDPDNMTYEELLDLGEAVGTQSRGLPLELINMLPTSRYKAGSFFSRKKSKARCVVCQMRYRLGERRTKLPCKHHYHSDCITRWLGINKVCPVCNAEVFGEESEELKPQVE